MTKTELESKVKELEGMLEIEQLRSTGHTISNCNIDMTKPDETKLAIARAVAEGMKALQGLGGDSYGLYFTGPKVADELNEAD